MNDQASWVAVGLAAVSMIGTVATTIAAKVSERKAARDKMEFGAEITDLKARVTAQAVTIADQAGQLAACNSHHEETQAELRSCRDQHEKSTRNVDDLRDEVAGLRGQISELERKNRVRES